MCGPQKVIAGEWVYMEGKRERPSSPAQGENSLKYIVIFSLREQTMESELGFVVATLGSTEADPDSLGEGFSSGALMRTSRC